jgi:hypothetical protein
MTRVKDPSSWFRQGVGGVNDTRYVMHEDVVVVFPILDGERLDVKMTKAFCRTAHIDYLNGRNIINVNGESQVPKEQCEGTWRI